MKKLKNLEGRKLPSAEQKKINGGLETCYERGQDDCYIYYDCYEYGNEPYSYKVPLDPRCSVCNSI